MKRSVFTHVAAWWAVLIILYGLLLWNAALASAVGAPSGILQAMLIAALLYLVYSGHRMARMALGLWAFFALIFPAGFKIASKVLIVAGSRQDDLTFGLFTTNLIDLFLGLTLLAASLRYMQTK